MREQPPLAVFPQSFEQSEKPFALDVAEAPGEQEDAKGAKDTKVEGEGHGVVGVEGAVENVGAVSERKHQSWKSS
jgi:hypothetical protein